MRKLFSFAEAAMYTDNANNFTEHNTKHLDFDNDWILRCSLTRQMYVSFVNTVLHVYLLLKLQLS